MPDATPGPHVARAARAAARRADVQRAVRAASAWGLAGAAVGAVLLTALEPSGAAAWIAGPGPAVAGALGGLAWVALRRTAPLAGARLLDRLAGTRERLASAWTPPDGALAEVQADDADARAATLDVRGLLPLDLRPAALLVASCAILALAAGMRQSADIPGPATPRAQATGATAVAAGADAVRRAAGAETLTAEERALLRDAAAALEGGALERDAADRAADLLDRLAEAGTSAAEAGDLRTAAAAVRAGSTGAVTETGPEAVDGPDSREPTDGEPRSPGGDAIGGAGAPAGGPGHPVPPERAALVRAYMRGY